jgi:hypothetical protein
MPMRLAVSILAAGLCLAAAHAAPVRREAPVTICGTIVERSWHKARFEPGRPGFSGSLGRDRTFPAHLSVLLADFTGIAGAQARRINFLLGHRGEADPPQRVMLRLSTDDPEALKNARSICVEGFRITGDEGGTWTDFSRVVVRG